MFNGTRELSTSPSPEHTEQVGIPNNTQHTKHRLASPAMILGLSGGLLISALMCYTALIHRAETQQGVTLTPLVSSFTVQIGFRQRDIVVLGLDNNGDNTDTIFTISIRDGETHITQIPRDSYLNSHSFGPLKVNALYARGGPEVVKSELSRLMLRPVRHHIVVNLHDIRELVDLIGGVRVNVPKRMYYADGSQNLVIDLQPGHQNLKGHDLEGFLRWRYDSEGDLGRLRRQQMVLRSLFHSMIESDNILQLLRLIGTAESNLKTDLGPMDLARLITVISTTQLQADCLQGSPFFEDGVSYLDTHWPNLTNNDEDINWHNHLIF